jgi:hypothetical protein
LTYGAGEARLRRIVFGTLVDFSQRFGEPKRRFVPFNSAILKDFCRVAKRQLPKHLRVFFCDWLGDRVEL